MDEHKWFGTPFSQLSPVKRREAWFFITGSRDVMTVGQKDAALAALKASGPMAPMQDYDAAVQRHVSPMVFG